MKLYKKNMLFLTMFVPIVALSEVHASAQDVHDIIEICTSSQRIMKDYALIGMKVTYGNPEEGLKETVKLLDKDMEDLLSHKLAKHLHDEEKSLQKLWQNIEHNLTKQPSKKEAMALHLKVNEFAHICDILADELAKDTHNPAEHYVVLISELNQLVQELTSTYIMMAWHAIPSDDYYKEVKEILHEYNKIYNEIMGSSEKMVSTNVKNELKILKKHFMLFEFMAESKSGRFVPLLFSKKSDKIFEETNKILTEEESEVEK